MPPAGIDVQILDAAILAGLGPELGARYIQWSQTDWPGWARRGWRRLKAGQGTCASA